MAWHPTWNEPERSESRYRYVRMQWGRPRATGTWWLLGLTVGVFLLFQTGPYRGWFVGNGALTAASVIFRGQIWRLVTFQFLHGGFDHIFWNMFGLWMFGRIVEFQLGTRRFVWLYLLCGIAGGLAECGLNFILAAGVNSDYAHVPIVGASAGVMGILTAFAVRNPNWPLYIFFILPVKAKWVAITYFAVTSYWVYTSLRFQGDLGKGPMIAHAAHLGGMVYAVVWMVVTGQVDWQVSRRLHSMLGGLGRSARRNAAAVHRDHPVVGGPNTGRNVSRDATDEDEQRLDAILRKIHDSGLESLSDDERRFLRYMSERGDRGP